MIREVASPADLAAAFIEAASAPLDVHNSGTPAEAETILAGSPHVASSIYSAAVVADEGTVRVGLNPS